MSGGSFNYLCYKDAESLVTQNPSELHEMGERLKQLGWTKQLAQHEAIMTKLEKIRAELESLDRDISGIAPVWKAVEWNDSLDGSDLFDKLQKHYRKGNQ